MKKILTIISLVSISLSAFGADLETLRTARAALFARSSLTSEQADSLFKLGTTILNTETALLSGHNVQNSTNNQLVANVKTAKKDLELFVSNHSENERNEQNIETLTALVKRKTQAENVLLESLKAEGF